LIMNFGKKNGGKQAIENIMEYEKEIEDILKSVIRELINPETVFKHIEQRSNYCNFCTS
jgi:predicted transcriptional regulator